MAVVEQLCAEGAAVAFSGIEPELVDHAVRDLTGQGHQVAACCGDHAEEAFCRRLVQEATGRWGRLHYLVNNAFSFIASGLGTEREAWLRSLEAGPGRLRDDHQPLGCSTPSSTPSQRSGDGRHREPFA